MATKQDARQVVLRAQSPFIGNAANEQLDVVFPRIDAEMAKLFEDRNILLTDGGTITFTGTQVQFSEALNLTLNQKISGAVPQVISLGSTSQNFPNNGDMLIAVLNRTAGTATVSIVSAGSALSAVVAANQEVFLIAKRVDAGDGTQRLYWRNGSAFNAGQTARLGSAGSGSGGSGVGDDLDSLLYRASFLDTFQENAANANSSINATSPNTNAVFNAAKNMYTISYDASKTVTVTGTAVTMSGAPAYTVVAGDILIVGTVAKKITVVTTQTSYTIESAFAANIPALTAACVSQAVNTKDIYNLAVDGAAISAGFPATTFSDIMVDYKDNATVGSNLFTPDVAPVVAYIASNDLTNFTSVSARQTNITDQFLDTVLPSSGSNLYIRFFANKTSGSGIVNLLTYKVFMQKSTVATAGGITNSAYAFTNGVGTPVNCSVSVVGGKTVVSLNWQYAVGVYSGTSASSIEVWVNGQKAPRFINSTLTPDLSFLESSSGSITLDRDYSSQNLSVEVFQRTQIVDNSTINTTAIFNQQEIMQNGFQAFVAQNQMLNPTISAGTPVAGSFYSSVIGRAAITDLSQDLRPRMGLERIPVQSLFQIPNEFGSNGEIVWGTPNDIFGRIRYVGSNWKLSALNTNGNQVYSAQNDTDYVEITFYGTGLNVNGISANTGNDWRVSVDGGAEGSNVANNTSANPIAGRIYYLTQVTPIVSGLTLGIHTVRIRNNNASASSFDMGGFEIINSSSSIVVNPGVSYINGQKLSLLSQQSVSFNSVFDSGTLGTRGGHIVMYQKSDGTIGKAVTPAGGSNLFTTSADHTNEEVVRTYFPAEFGVGRADDWTTSTGSNISRAFTLDDGTATLCSSSSQVGQMPGFTQAYGIYMVSGATYSLTFVGTGLDLELFTGTAEAGVYALSMDGTSLGNLAYSVPALGVLKKNYKIASGLPYGTHTLSFTASGSISQIILSKFITYQPKKPSIPSGAVELADFNVLATYVANASPAFNTTSTGVIYKTPTREPLYNGTWGGGTTQTVGTDPGGFTVRSSTNGDWIQYSFFGTGIELLLRGGSGTVTGTILIDGVAYTGAGTAIGSGGSWTPGTSTYVASSGAGSALQISGLALGFHTIRYTATVSANTTNFTGFNIITPTHAPVYNNPNSLQGDLTIGSASLSDNRKFTPIKDSNNRTKNVASADGIDTVTTTSTTYVPVPDLGVEINVGANARLDISFYSTTQNSASGGFADYAIWLDGQKLSGDMLGQSAAASNSTVISMRRIIPVSPGVHKVEIYWHAGGGTQTSPVDANSSRNLTVVEI